MHRPLRFDLAERYVELIMKQEIPVEYHKYIDRFKWIADVMEKMEEDEGND